MKEKREKQVWEIINDLCDKEFIEETYRMDYCARSERETKVIYYYGQEIWRWGGYQQNKNNHPFWTYYYYPESDSGAEWDERIKKLLYSIERAKEEYERNRREICQKYQQLKEAKERGFYGNN